MNSVSHRLERRKYLHNRLRLASNAMCFLGLFGILLMITDNEITFAIGDDRDTIINWLIKLIISISTFILIILIIYYHKLDLKLYSIKNSVDNWCIQLNFKRIFLILLEILICSIHPIPRYFHPNWLLNSTTVTNPLSISYISLDVALGLPMFLRLYLICRFMLYRSHLIHNASSQSIGYLNQVSMDFFFLMKTYLEQWPTRCLIIFSSLVFFIGSWSLRACNYRPTSEHIPILDSMWLFIVTFTTVGYGDFTPSTYCGRTIAALIAFMGVLCTALLISVLAQKLILTRWEKYVYNLVSNIQLVKDRENQAANVIKFSIKVWYLKRRNKSKSLKYMKFQWKLFQSINRIQHIKLEQRRLVDNCLSLVDLFHLQRHENNHLENLRQQINIIQRKFLDINQNMNNIQYKLNVLLNRF